MSTSSSVLTSPGQIDIVNTQAQQPCRLVKPTSLPLADPLPPPRLQKLPPPAVSRRPPSKNNKPKPRPTSHYQHPPHFHYLDPSRVSYPSYYYPSYSFILSSRRHSTPSSVTSRCTAGFPLPILKPHRLVAGRTMATAVQPSPLSTERFERTTFAEPAHVRIETTTTTTVISRDRDLREGDQYYTIPKGYPGGNVSHNPPIIRVVQKPIEALNVDGDNPFRPEGDLYKESEEIVKAYTLPRGSGAPSPLPEDYPESPNQNGHIHTGEITAVSNAGINLSSPTRSRITSSSTESSHSVVNHPAHPSDSQSGADHVEKPSTARRKSSADVETNHRKQSHQDEDVHPDKKKERKGGKKKKKPVGCGGDKRCSIM